MEPNRSYSSPAPPPDLILGDTRRLLFWFCCSGAFQKFSSSIQAYISCDCTSDIILDRLFHNLLPVTVKSGTVPTHMNTVLSLELFPPLSPWCFPFLLHPLLSDLFAYLFCNLSSSSSVLPLSSVPVFLCPSFPCCHPHRFSATALWVTHPRSLTLENSSPELQAYFPSMFGHTVDPPNAIC